MSVDRMGTCLTTVGMRRMLLSVNIHPGSSSSKKEAVNKVEEKILETIQQSMRSFLPKIQKNTTKCGLPATSTIRAGDARYNNLTFSAVGKNSVSGSNSSDMHSFF